MKKHILTLWLPVGIYAGLIFIASAIPQKDLPRNPYYPDYLLHCVEYAPFGFLVYRALKNTKKAFSAAKVFLLCAAFIFLYSLSDEFHQLFVPGRDASLFDVASDAVGAFVGLHVGRRFFS